MSRGYAKSSHIHAPIVAWHGKEMSLLLISFSLLSLISLNLIIIKLTGMLSNFENVLLCTHL